MYQTDPPRPPRDYLPTMYDLPGEDPPEPGLPDEFHLLPPRLLSETFAPPTIRQKRFLRPVTPTFTMMSPYKLV
ncbi:MAG: hypothetical protein Kow00121_49930 [Elainellaceae cyanobacterium]